MSDRPGNDSSGTRTRHLPFPLRMYRHVRRHAHDVRPAAERDGKRERAAQLTLTFPDYDPRQLPLWGRK